MSYSLTMIETFYPLIDKLSTVLAPSGIIGVADFYVSPKHPSDPTRQLSWITRWFWAIWFDQDNVFLTPGRREFLEYKFKVSFTRINKLQTVKTLSARNSIFPPFAKIPYYVWIGAQKEDPNMPNIKKKMPLFTLDIPAEGDDQFPTSDNEYDDDITEASKVLPSVTQFQLVSSDHIHGQGQRWRMPFDIKLLDRFSTYIYAFAWEDAKVDLQYLDLKPTDRMFVITSGGCNVLGKNCFNFRIRH